MKTNKMENGKSVFGDCDCFKVTSEVLLDYCECVPDSISEYLDRMIEEIGCPPQFVIMNLPTYETMDMWMRKAVTPDSVDWDEVWRIWELRDFREEIEEFASPELATMQNLFSRATRYIAKGIPQDSSLAEALTCGLVGISQIERLFKEEHLMGFTNLHDFLCHVARENGWEHLIDQIDEHITTNGLFNQERDFVGISRRRLGPA